MKVAQKVHDRFAIAGIQVSRRFVGQQDQRLAYYRPRHRHPLLLAARKLARQVLSPMGHPHFFQCFVYALFAFGRSHASISQGELDILIDRQIPDQVKALEDKSNAAVAVAGPLRHLQPLYWLAIQPVAALGGRVEEAKN